MQGCMISSLGGGGGRGDSESEGGCGSCGHSPQVVGAF